MTYSESSPSARDSTLPTPLDTAVLFLVFNRPDVTAKVFEAIRQARPPRLYVAADGPRSSRPGEMERCAEVRRITSQIDWPCKVMSLFRGENLGCKRAVSGAISWFFEHEEEGIILEDDCLPASSFFGFCQELLKKYRHDHRIWQICGTAFVTDRLNRESSDSYLFSKYGPIWGWATWRRAWAYYNADMIDWPLMSKAPWFESAYEDTSEAKMRLELGNKLYFSKIDTWDYQWGFTKNFQSGLSAIPLSNMIVNIGFGSEATHTTRINLLAPTGKHEMDFPIRHPAFVLADSQHDQLYRKHLVVGSKDARLKNTLKRMIRLLFGRYPL